MEAPTEETVVETEHTSAITPPDEAAAADNVISEPEPVVESSIELAMESQDQNQPQETAEAGSLTQDEAEQKPDVLSAGPNLSTETESESVDDASEQRSAG